MESVLWVMPEIFPLALTDLLWGGARQVGRDSTWLRSRG